MLKYIPNALTLTRLILAPVIAWHIWVGAKLFGYLEDVGDKAYAEMTTSLAIAAVLFVVAALTDLFDGMAARAFNAQSKFGRIIDPIADKALVGLPLIAIVLSHWQRFPNFYFFFATLAVIVIVFRDVMMTWVRLSAPDGEGTRVSALAKIKTALELVVVGAYLVGAALKHHIFNIAMAAKVDALLVLDLASKAWLVWIALLVVTAALSAYTAWQYLAPAKKN